jgi:hypothetical protein
MATNFTRLTIINAALLSQGQTELQAEDDGSLEWRTLAANWANLVESELEDAAMAHSFVEEELPARAGDGSFGFSDRYLTPSAALHVRDVWTEDASGERTRIDWYQGRDAIHVNSANGIWCEYVDCSETTDFPPLFVRGVQQSLEAIILRALKEEYGNADKMDARAQSHFQRARTSSSNQKSKRRFYSNESRFVRARFRRG